MDFGCFVELEGMSGEKREGLVHASQLSAARLADVKTAVRRGQRVFVKVISMAGSRLSLSMKDADQETGADLFPQRSAEGRARAEEEARAESSNPAAPASAHSNPINPGVTLDPSDDADERSSMRAVKRLSSPELWEARQLIASGVLPVEDYPTFDEEHGVLAAAETEVELEVELNEQEAPFLRGQTAAATEFSPMRIVKNPDGSMQRAAMNQAGILLRLRDVDVDGR